MQQIASIGNNLSEQNTMRLSLSFLDVHVLQSCLLICHRQPPLGNCSVSADWQRTYHIESLSLLPQIFYDRKSISGHSWSTRTVQGPQSLLMKECPCSCIGQNLTPCTVMQTILFRLCRQIQTCIYAAGIQIVAGISAKVRP